jgi:hypothetical protein
VTLIAAVLVSRSDLDCDEGLGKPLVADVSSRVERSHKIKATYEGLGSIFEGSQSISKADFQVLPCVSQVHHRGLGGRYISLQFPDRHVSNEGK